jgi:rhodanese-related sulfurtransferase
VATIIEVLDQSSYEEFHLPTAINVPLENDFDDQIVKAVPDRDHPVVLYCMDEDCPASQKAEKRMEALGYSHVYHYKGGKME